MQPDPIGFLADTSVGKQLQAKEDRLVRPDRHHRHLDRVRPFDPGHERRGNARPGFTASVEAPKLPNFRKAAFVVFVYSLVFTAGISFLAVMIIPETSAVTEYSENLISACHAHDRPRLAQARVNAFVVIIGFMILAGAVNTAIIGSNGVLNRVARTASCPSGSSSRTRISALPIAC